MQPFEISKQLLQTLYPPNGGVAGLVAALYGQRIALQLVMAGWARVQVLTAQHGVLCKARSAAGRDAADEDASEQDMCGVLSYTEL